MQYPASPISLQHKATYQAARTVAPAVEAYFARKIASSEQDEMQKIPAPSREVIEAIIDSAFWASLRREEGLAPKISLAFLSPADVEQPVLFGHRMPLKAEALTKIAPGVERPGIHLGVWHDKGELYVWGITHAIPSNCFIVDVPEPGLLVVKYKRANSLGKFANVAVLKGDQIKLVDESSAHLPDCPELLTSLLGFNSPDRHSNILIQLAVSMQMHHRGGTLLVVPAGTTAWQQSVVYPLKYAVEPAFSGFAELMKQDEQIKKRSRWREALRREVSSIAGLTAIDGATLLTDAYELLAFGVKIGRRLDYDPIEQILFTEPVVGSQPQTIHPSQHGGMRHLSAAQFVHDQRDAIALVASQDGSFTIFAWSQSKYLVHAHRIDTLLL